MPVCDICSNPASRSKTQHFDNNSSVTIWYCKNHLRLRGEMPLTFKMSDLEKD